MSTRLISQTALKKVPGLYKQDKTRDPLISATISAADQGWQCYIAEAGRKGKRYEVFALFVGKHGHNWAQVPIQVIEQDLSLAHMVVRWNVLQKPARVSALAGRNFVRQIK
jgi:hypothetical protein